MVPMKTPGWNMFEEKVCGEFSAFTGEGQNKFEKCVGYDPEAKTFTVEFEGTGGFTERFTFPASVVAELVACASKSEGK